MSGKKVVVFHQGALGDFIAAAAAVDELARTQDYSRVDFWSKPEHASLLTGKSYLGRCLPSDSPLCAALLQEDLWRKAPLPDLLTGADLVFIFGQTGSRLLAERLSLLLPADVFWIKSFPKVSDRPVHVSEFLRGQLAALGLPIPGCPLALSPPDTEIYAAQDLLAKLGIDSKPVFVHPGSGGLRKVWPLEYWGGLLDWIRQEIPHQPLLSVGPADQYLDRFSQAMHKAGIPVVSGLSPLRLSALLSLSGLYIGSDSGVSHLAAAVGAPTIAVFGPSDPLVWAPRGNRAIAVRKKWREEEVLRWEQSDRPEFYDEQIISVIKSLLSGSASA